MALEQPKRPAGGGFGVFMNEKRAEFTKECAGQKASMVAKLAGERWKALAPAQKAPYEKKFVEAKAKFDKDMEAFLAAGGVKQKGTAALRAEKRKAKEGRGKKAKDPDAPKKPVGGAYGVWLNENREKIAKSLPKGHSVTDIGKAAGEQWKKVAPAARKPYEATYEKKMKEYTAAMEEYKKTKGDEAEGDVEEEAEEEEKAEEEEEAAPKKKLRKEAAQKKKVEEESAAPKKNSRKAGA